MNESSKVSENYLFIIAQHRTGSTLLKNILDAHEEVSMAFDEMNLYEHFRPNTLDRLLNKRQLSSKELTSLIENKRIYGTFWKDFEKSGLDFEQLEDELSTVDLRDALDVVEVILTLLRRKNNTSKSGVKYPVHFNGLSKLLNKFPESRIIFLTRHPAAIIVSKLNDPSTKKRKEASVFHRFVVHYFTILYFSVEYAMSVRKYRQHRDRLLLVRYEDLVKKKEETIRLICEYCNLDFNKNLLTAKGKGSSHKVSSDQGIHSKSLDLYKNILSKFDLGLISLITRKGYKVIENEFSTDV